MLGNEVTHIGSWHMATCGDLRTTLRGDEHLHRYYLRDIGGVGRLLIQLCYVDSIQGMNSGTIR